MQNKQILSQQQHVPLPFPPPIMHALDAEPLCHRSHASTHALYLTCSNISPHEHVVLEKEDGEYSLNTTNLMVRANKASSPSITLCTLPHSADLPTFNLAISLFSRQPLNVLCVMFCRRGLRLLYMYNEGHTWNIALRQAFEGFSVHNTS